MDTITSVSYVYDKKHSIIYHSNVLKIKVMKPSIKPIIREYKPKISIEHEYLCKHFCYCNNLCLLRLALFFLML
ncbi:MAG: hypothetical protein ACI4PF_07050 [Christensenellales bacterium]